MKGLNIQTPEFLHTSVNYFKYRGYKILAFLFCSYIVMVFTEVFLEILAKHTFLKFSLFSIVFHLLINRPQYLLDIINTVMQPFAFLRTGETGRVTTTGLEKGIQMQEMRPASNEVPESRVG